MSDSICDVSAVYNGNDCACDNNDIVYDVIDSVCDASDSVYDGATVFAI